MLQDNLLLIISLLFATSMLAILSDKLRISYPIFLVMAGLGISLIPGIPNITLQPDIVFIVFLPPLLYAAAWNTSWHDFWRMRRPIGMLAMGLVIFTAVAVAFVSHWMIPDFSLALGFLLGGVVSPTDAVAATGIVQNANLPKRVVTVLEGESLVNDASGLVVYRVAMAALLTGQFILWKAAANFFVVAFMGIIVGLAIALIVYAIHRWLPTTAAIDTSITLVSPYLMYIAAEHFHFSGVLSVVTGGLFLSYHSSKILSYSSRLQSISVWNILTFLLNGVVFILIGLQLPHIADTLGEYSLKEGIYYGLIISVVAVVVRILWVYPGAYLPRMCSAKIRRREPNPGVKTIFIIGWSGMRGVVSLASALAIPISLVDGVAFPQRNIILFITFVVILFTLVLQGLSLPFLIRWLKIPQMDSEEDQKLGIRLRLAHAVLDYINGQYEEEAATIDAFSRLKDRYERMAAIAGKRLENKEDGAGSFLPRYRQLLLELVGVQREELTKMRQQNSYSDELLRKREYELDLEEARFRR